MGKKGKLSGTFSALLMINSKEGQMTVEHKEC
jgi:hypothetical protein